MCSQLMLVDTSEVEYTIIEMDTYLLQSLKKKRENKQLLSKKNRTKTKYDL